MFINSGSQLGMIFVPTGLSAMSGDILIVMTPGRGVAVLLTTSV